MGEGEDDEEDEDEEEDGGGGGTGQNIPVQNIRSGERARRTHVMSLLGPMGSALRGPENPYGPRGPYETDLRCEPYVRHEPVGPTGHMSHRRVFRIPRARKMECFHCPDWHCGPH